MKRHDDWRPSEHRCATGNIFHDEARSTEHLKHLNVDPLRSRQCGPSDVDKTRVSIRVLGNQLDPMSSVGKKACNGFALRREVLRVRRVDHRSDKLEMHQVQDRKAIATPEVH